MRALRRGRVLAVSETDNAKFRRRVLAVEIIQDSAGVAQCIKQCSATIGNDPVDAGFKLVKEPAVQEIRYYAN